MGTSKWLVVAVAAVVASPALADQDRADGDRKTEFTVSPYVGGSHVKIDAENTEDGVRRGLDLALVGVSIGIRMPIGLTFEGGRADARHDDITDWFQEGFGLTQKYIAVGYQINLGDAWLLTPKYGRAQWRIDADAINFIDENGVEDDKLKGYDNFVEASLSKQIKESFSLGLTVRGLETEFGQSLSGVVAATWSF